MARRTGRRPGNPDTREAILAAARATFAERGFDAASIRAIAAAAGVDPALVHHYFGTKEELFRATVSIPVDPAELVPGVLAGGRDEVGERLVRTFLAVWDSPVGTAAVALLRSAVSNQWTARLLREFLVTQVLRRVVDQLDLDPAEVPLRGALVATQIAGLAMMRYVIRLEPVATASPDTLAATIGPTIQRYLTGPLDAG
ncbi:MULTISPECIES: TetR family transcriptional regulator [Micromonospora]|uniref:TetR/AcrR family transcriptional regulator n=1 Tax=Micromonospora solifontis TaxID=2487138 RepID=A0ABX9WGT7_9ACTN|nr:MULTISPECIES: TetR family transcriptional regulator [Micromonospora]NES12220.1 TetR/AcrR family transcriptional regulator [Micromonospora sp. PPF5-17B]NES36978.1 TetR/AcrR family transcriptional regulator [Micromonospora solifontis]NES54297.1 TetR/AcrR family transcriptional regulator [Micromonospora sp. PPF5-6]RNL98897.1 TetR/AcrR family transcriptional regulator [Micromonospora solifontis]